MPQRSKSFRRYLNGSTGHLNRLSDVGLANAGFAGSSVHPVRDVVGDPEIEMRAAPVDHDLIRGTRVSVRSSDLPSAHLRAGEIAQYQCACIGLVDVREAMAGQPFGPAACRRRHLRAPGPNSGEPMSMRFVTRVSLGNPLIWIAVLVLL